MVVHNIGPKETIAMHIQRHRTPEARPDDLSSLTCLLDCRQSPIRSAVQAVWAWTVSFRRLLQWSAQAECAAQLCLTGEAGALESTTHTPRALGCYDWQYDCEAMHAFAGRKS